MEALPYAGIDLAADKDGIAVSVHDTGSGRGLAFRKAPCVKSGIIRGVLYRRHAEGLDNGESRDGLAVALELRLALVICCFDGGLNLLDGDGIALGDDEGSD